MAMKIVIGMKSGKSYQKELTKDTAEHLYGKKLGDEIKGDLVEFSGAVFKICGGSDEAGFPMRSDVLVAGRKRILTKRGVGFKGKTRGKSFDGLRVRKTVSGAIVYEKTHQLNLKCISGEDIIEKAFAPKVEENQEEVKSDEKSE